MNPGEIVGVGNTATVYEWEHTKVVKLFHEGYSYQAAIREFENAMAVNDMDFPKPKAFYTGSIGRRKSGGNQKSQGNTVTVIPGTNELNQRLYKRLSVCHFCCTKG